MPTIILTLCMDNLARDEKEILMCSFFKEPTRFCLLPSHAITIELCLPGIATISATYGNIVYMV